MKKIGFFLPSCDGGGAERVVITLANGFAARGYDVDLILAASKGPYLVDISASVRVVDLKAGRLIKSLLPLIRYIYRERPSAILSAMDHANLIALMARAIARTPTRIVVSVHNTISKSMGGGGAIVRKIILILIPLIYRYADVVCTVSKGASKDFSDFFKIPIDKVQTIYNPFDLKLIESRAAEPVAHPWFVEGAPPVLLAVGRLTKQKNYPVLIKAFDILRKKRPLRLLILGEGELRNDLMDEIKKYGFTEDDIQIPGFLDNPYAFMARCGVFVMSSSWEGLPTVLIEALACGAPVVSSNCPSGPDEILEGGRWGRLVPVGDSSALAQAIEDVLDTPPELLPDVYSRAREFEQNKAIDGYINLLVPQDLTKNAIV